MTLAVSCEGCEYQPYRQAHTTVPFSAMDYVNEDGDVTPYEPTFPAGYLQGDKIGKEFIAFVKERNLKLVPLAELLVQECSRSEAARELGLPPALLAAAQKSSKSWYGNFALIEM